MTDPAASPVARSVNASGGSGRRWINAGLALLLSLSYSQTRAAEKHGAVVANDRVRVNYDLAAGTFDIIDVASGNAIVHGAHAEWETWTSTDPRYGRTARITEGTGALRHERTLSIACAAPDAPTLIADFTVGGAGDPALVLRGGITNTGEAPLQVRAFRPLAGGVIGPDGPWTDVRTLNGDSGMHQNQVAAQRFRSSANNLLLTFKAGGQRRSLVLGGLKVADFTRWVRTESTDGWTERGLEIARAFPGARLVAYLNCGASVLDPGPAGSARVESVSPYRASPGLTLPAGRSGTLLIERGWPMYFPAAAGAEPLGSMVRDETEVVFAAAGLDPKRRYAVGFSWWDHDGRGRVQTVSVGTTEDARQILLEAAPLPAFRGQDQPAEERAVLVPAGAVTNGELRIAFAPAAPDATDESLAVVSEVWLWELAEDAAIPAGWMKGRPVSTDTAAAAGAVLAVIEASDPVGRLVAPGETYRPTDSFYFDGGTADPFVALEQYGRRLREANAADPHAYHFPTLCAWYAGVWKTPGAQDHPELSRHRLNTTAGLIEELDHVRASGFSRYTQVAVRLVPDTYAPVNPQGWWDDEHWRAGGYYTAPHDSSAAFGAAARRLGGLAFTYIQPSSWVGLSRDFREAHRTWLCAGDVERGLDVSQPEVEAHLARVTAELRGSIDGVMVDYGDDLWRREAARGGFADPKMTATAFYRRFFKLWKDGLGAGSWLHERNLMDPNNDLTLGIVDLQRTSGDTDRISPDIVSRGGLRWYKNRVVLNYDMDSKEMNEAWEGPGFTGSARDGRRMTLTMTSVASSRLLLANSFRDLAPEALRDLSRVFPLMGGARSARPVDAFVTAGWPGVYDYKVDDRWHQVVLFNATRPTVEKEFSVALSGEPVDGGLGLDAGRDYYAYDFWNDAFLGRLNGAGRLRQTLRPGEARMISLHEVEPNPQFLSTNRHLMQGAEDAVGTPRWDAVTRRLRGTARVVAGETYAIIVAMNGWQVTGAYAAESTTRLVVEPQNRSPGLMALHIDSPIGGQVEWAIACEPMTMVPGIPH